MTASGGTAGGSPSGPVAGGGGFPVLVDVVVETPGWLAGFGAAAPAAGADGAAAAEDLEATAARLEPFVARILATAARFVPAEPGESVALAVAFCDDEAVRSLNRSYRDKDRPTNVLSFPALDTPGPEAAERFIGDVVLARETVEREAEAIDRPVESHLAHLVVHGFLHLLGYDHENDADAREMEGLEIAILEALGIPDPYGDVHTSVGD